MGQQISCKTLTGMHLTMHLICTPIEVLHIYQQYSLPIILTWNMGQHWNMTLAQHNIGLYCATCYSIIITVHVLIAPLNIIMSAIQFH